MFADSTNTALCRWSLLFVFLSSSVQIPPDGCPEIHMHHPSHLRMKPQPLENNQTHCQLSHKKERRKKKKIHNAETHIRSFSKTNCMFLFLCQHAITYKISNTEHVRCACNNYKLQELTFKCLNLYFVRVIRTLKRGIEGLQILF